MPIYEYECSGCGHGFELRQGFSAEPVSQCPMCQGRASRVIHSVSVIFKGSGFYVNDYKRSSVSDPTPSKKDSAPAGAAAPAADIKVGPNESKAKSKSSASS